jgi:hypothetical protein
VLARVPKFQGDLRRVVRCLLFWSLLGYERTWCGYRQTVENDPEQTFLADKLIVRFALPYHLMALGMEGFVDNPAGGSSAMLNPVCSRG